MLKTIKAQLRLLLSRKLYDLKMGWISTGGLRRHWQRTMERWERTSDFSASFERSSRLVSWNWPGSGLNISVCVCVCFLFITSKPSAPQPLDRQCHIPPDVNLNLIRLSLGLPNASRLLVELLFNTASGEPSWCLLLSQNVCFSPRLSGGCLENS